ncbi:hypothetical protein D3C87_64940 [compost metagenome]
MIEKDNIQELFSKAFENQTAAVKPELWAGVQAKMAAAGVASTATVATKGLSALTKWIIGSAAVGTVGVVTTVIALNSGQEPADKKADSPKEISQNVASKPDSESVEETTDTGSRMTYTEPHVISDEPKVIAQEANPKKDKKDYKEIMHYDLKLAEENPAPADRKSEPKSEEKKSNEATPKVAAEDKKTNSSNSNAAQTSKPATNTVNETPKKHPEDPKEQVFADLEIEVTKFPTMFTPNGDRSNDIYFVTVENIHDFQLVIIDQNNREVFRSTTPGEDGGWNGINKAGDEAPGGSYAAIVTGKNKNGKSFRDIQLFELRR